MNSTSKVMNAKIELKRIRSDMLKSEARVQALDSKIGYLMSQRVDSEEHIAECLHEIAIREAIINEQAPF